MPIGNAKDISQRAFDTLASVATIFCEDTRVTKALLQQWGILNQQTLTRMDQHQEKRSLSSFDAAIQMNDVAFVTDAGSPGLSDPGGLLVAHARAIGVPVILLPGPSALATFIAGCGVLLSDFYFGGFLPKKDGELAKACMPYKKSCGYLVRIPERIALFVPPLQILIRIPVVIAKELTKEYEKFIRGSASEVHQKVVTMDCRGEWWLWLMHVLISMMIQNVFMALLLI